MAESKPKTAQDVYELICKLGADERDDLLVMLEHDRDDGWASPEIKQAWLEEIDRLEQLHREGKNPNIPWDESRRSLRKLLASLRK